MGIAKLRVSILDRVPFWQELPLPSDTVVLGIGMGDAHTMYLRVKHPDIPEGLEFVLAEFTKDASGNSVFDKWTRCDTA
ncbi:MAG: hypothetical protein WC683_18445 [bacterium]